MNRRSFLSRLGIAALAPMAKLMQPSKAEAAQWETQLDARPLAHSLRGISTPSAEAATALRRLGATAREINLRPRAVLHSNSGPVHWQHGEDGKL